jgi:hypothetical protein
MRWGVRVIATIAACRLGKWAGETFLGLVAVF